MVVVICVILLKEQVMNDCGMISGDGFGPAFIEAFEKVKCILYCFL